MLNIPSRNSSFYKVQFLKYKFHPQHDNEKTYAHTFNFFHPLGLQKERKVLNGWERLKPEKCTIERNPFILNIIETRVKFSDFQKQQNCDKKC